MKRINNPVPIGHKHTFSAPASDHTNMYTLETDSVSSLLLVQVSSTPCSLLSVGIIDFIWLCVY